MPYASVVLCAISVSADSFISSCLLCFKTLRNSLLSRPSDDREMSERWAREKNADFLTKNEQKSHIYAPKFAHVKKSCIFTPDWVHCATRAYNKVSIQKDSIYAGLLWAGGLEGNLVHIEKAFIDALLLTNKKLRTLFTIPVRNKVSDCAYGYDIYQPRTLEHCTLYIVTLYISWVCHIGVGFIVVY